LSFIDIFFVTEYLGKKRRGKVTYGRRKKSFYGGEGHFEKNKHTWLAYPYF
jgi:hypothetical protein